MNAEYIEKIYAGWLAKIIGIRLGAPIEGWTYEKIKNLYGDLRHYPIDYKLFAADDDSNGPLFFLRALEDGKKGVDLTAQDVAEALLNYAPFEHGFFWWGGYGVSTEHTAYLNLRNGIEAPRSGSKVQNGLTISEQIGGQIFIDTWGLVTPGNPDLAAKLSEKAASVTHDGNGIYGGIFVAVCISYAFAERDIRAILKKGLSYIPSDCEYSRAVRAVMDYHSTHPENWRDCFDYVHNNFGYDKYPGNCHIIPNIAVMVLALLYGNGDFSNTINICNMCGWDTDCNVGNVATIMGVRNGLAAIDYYKWRAPINDVLICSSVIGSLNIQDIPYGATYIAKQAFRLAHKEPPAPWREIFENKTDSCHFEFPGSTHAMRVRVVNHKNIEYILTNTKESAFTGSRSLKIVVNALVPAERVLVYKKTYYRPNDFHDSRYDPSFSPVLYPGQTIHGSAFLPDYATGCTVRLYARNSRTGELITNEGVALEHGKWSELNFKIPAMENALLDEAGFAFDLHGSHGDKINFISLVDDLYFDGAPSYTLDFSIEEPEEWHRLRTEISQFTRLKGLMYLEDGLLNLSCSDFAEAYTGRYDWSDYTTEFILIPKIGKQHFINVRVQGGIRCYAIGFDGDGNFALLKNANGYKVLSRHPLDWECGHKYKIKASVKDNTITAWVDDTQLLCYTDNDDPYLTGSIGVSVRCGSHCQYCSIHVN